MSISRVIIAGSMTGVGKSIMSLGIMRALVNRGLKVAPFRLGSDFIDPIFQGYATGVESGNLDVNTLDDHSIAYLFNDRVEGADIAVMDGTLSLFDTKKLAKHNPVTEASRILGAPTILVIRATGIASKSVSQVKAYRDQERKLNIKGVLISQPGSERHYQLIKDLIEKDINIRVLGYLPDMPELDIPERAGTPATPETLTSIDERLNLIAQQVEEHVNLNLLLSIAKDVKAPPKSNIKIAPITDSVNIGIAMDSAFTFYYGDNFALLEKLGVQLHYFSPLNDPSIPEGMDALYFGGGYIAECAPQLSENQSMRESILEAHQNHVNIFTEGDGILYMCSEYLGTEMCGVFSGRGFDTGNKKRIGYVQTESMEDTLLTKKGMRFSAYENRTSDVVISSPRRSFRVLGLLSVYMCGYKQSNVLSCFQHINFWTNREMAVDFVKNCIKSDSFI